MKKALVVGIIVLFIGMSITSSSGTTVVQKSTIPIFNGNTLYVGGSGEGNYTTIQSAINDAFDGDTVFVYEYSSPYYENIIINKMINLIGENKETTVIDGEHKDNVVIINVDNVVICNFTLKNAKTSYEGWYKHNVISILECNNAIISDNTISIGLEDVDHVRAGIFLKASSNNLIKNNLLIEDKIVTGLDGIVFFPSSQNNIISGNEIYRLSTAIRTRYPDGVKNNTICDNYLYQNGVGITNQGSYNKIINNVITHSGGIGNLASDNTLISGNTITYNSNWFSAALSFTAVSDNAATNNHISNNYRAISLYSCNGINLIENNNITNNVYGVDSFDSCNTVISKNNFIKNQYGVHSFDSYNNVISKNNFIKNQYNVRFSINYDYCPIVDFLKKDKYSKNYWNCSRSFPKVFIGKGSILLGIITFPVLTIDWRPAKVPYIIPSAKECDID